MNFVGAFDDPGAGIAAGPLVAARVVDIVSGVGGLLGGDMDSADNWESGEDGVVNMGILGELSAVSLGVVLMLVFTVSGRSSS